MASGRQVEVEGRELKLTNLDKVLYPKTGFTKGEMIDYYAKVAPAMIPHLSRPRGHPAPLPGRGRGPGRRRSSRSAAPNTGRNG